MSVALRRAAASSTPAPAGSPACSPSRGRPAQPALPADARRGHALPPARPAAARHADAARPTTSTTLGAFLAVGGYSPLLRRALHAAARVAAVWSCGPETVRCDYPARYLFTFLDHHGMLAVTGSPQWRTVVGGSRTLRRAGGEGAHRGATGRRRCRALAPAPPTASRSATTPTAAARVDAVVVATHPDQALRLLADADRRRARRARRVRLLAQRDPAAHRRLGAAAPPGAPGRRGTTCMTTCADPPTRRCSSATT